MINSLVSKSPKVNLEQARDLPNLSTLAVSERIETAIETSLLIHEQLPLFDQTLETLMQERMVYIQEIQEAAQHNHALKTTYTSNIKKYNDAIRQKEQELKELEIESKELSRKIDVLTKGLPEFQQYYCRYRPPGNTIVKRDPTATVTKIRKELGEILGDTNAPNLSSTTISTAIQCSEKEISSPQIDPFSLFFENEILQITENLEETENLHTEISQPSSTTLDLTKMAQESEETLALCTEVIEQSSAMIERLEKKNLLMQQQASYLYKENEKLQEAQQAEISRKKEILSDLETRISKMQAEIAQKKSTYQPLRASMSSVESQWAKIRQGLEELDRARLRGLTGSYYSPREPNGDWEGGRGANW